LAFQSRINLARFYDADHKAKRTGLKQQHQLDHDHVSGFFPLLQNEDDELQSQAAEPGLLFER